MLIGHTTFRLIFLSILFPLIRSMEVTARTPKLRLPCKTRISLCIAGLYIDLVTRKDGTVNRCLADFLQPKVPPTLKPIDGIYSYDVIVNPTTNIWFRVYVPTEHTIEDLPLIVFYHGGGFALLAPNVKTYDDTCHRLAKNLPAIVISAEYRLTPEHKHPAQYDDGIDVLKFLDNAENMSKCSLQNVNVSRCFVAGDSAGGNLAHFVALKAGQTTFKQLKVIGLVAIQPFFGGEERTDSEIELDGRVPFLNLRRTDWFWNAFLPQGKGDRDHSSINVSGPNATDISKMYFPKTMVVVAGFDILKDWQKRYYEWLQKSGKQVQLAYYPNMFHDFVCYPELPESDQLISEMKEFIYQVFNKGSKE